MLYNDFMIDLHIHSTYSDGTCSVNEIIEKAKQIGLNQIAITDHNILKGSIEAKSLNLIDCIVGTELSVDYKGSEVHLLAYFPNGSDYKNVQFIINEGNAYKKIAIMETIEILNEMGFELDVTELSKYSKGFINRVHVCMAMMDHGYIKSINEGFEKYVGENCKAYVQRKVISIEEAIDAIHKDKGIAVLAHPYEYKDISSVDDLLNDTINKIDGIECFHPSATKENSSYLLEIAKTHNKLITGGSDYHGINKPNINLGMMNVSDEYKLKERID